VKKAAFRISTDGYFKLWKNPPLEFNLMDISSGGKIRQ